MNNSPFDPWLTHPSEKRGIIAQGRLILKKTYASYCEEIEEMSRLRGLVIIRF